MLFMQINKTMRYIRFKDPDLKSLRLSFIRAKSQAKYRNQTWDIDFDDYLDLWRVGDKYRKPGRCKNDFHMTRKDIQQGWSVANVQILNRSEHLRARMLKQNG